MRIEFDSRKSDKLKRERGYSLFEVAQLFLSTCVVDIKNDDPEQFRAIGYVDGQLLTVIFEYRLDEMDLEYRWLVTYWKATSQERLMYVENS